MSESSDSSPILARVAKRLRARREQLGMSRASLAKKSGVSYCQIRRYEEAEQMPTIDKMHHLALALKKKIPWFTADYEEQV